MAWFFPVAGRAVMGLVEAMGVAVFPSSRGCRHRGDVVVGWRDGAGIVVGPRAASVA